MLRASIMRIYIPSRGRAAICRTWQGLPLTERDKAIMVVPITEVAAYTKQGLPATPCPVQGIGAVRQWICDNHNIKTFGHSLLMLDDDLEFFERRPDDLTKLKQADPRSIARMLKELDKLACLYAHGGVATREGANRCTDKVTYNERCLRALYYDVTLMRKYKVRFDRVPVMEDFDVALQFLRLGMASGKLNHWAQDQPGSNTAGGCSTYRTAAVQAKGATELARLHPDFVTVVEKPAPKNGGWNGEPRLDVRIAWKKAYDLSTRAA